MKNNRVILLDVSFWQDDDYTPYKIDFKIAWRNGADGVIIRAGQNTWEDEDYLDFCRNADAAKFPRGAYWFYDSRVSPITQADLFASLVKRSGYPQLGIWGDYEENYRGVYAGERNFKMFMDRLKTHFPGKLIGVYTGPAYWRTNTTAAGREQFKSYPLWIANYDVLIPDVPPPWSKYNIWQFTERGDGHAFGAESSRIDVNYFGGSLDEYRAFFGLVGYEPSTPPDEGDYMYNCVVKSTATPYVNLRDNPNGNDIGDMYPGTAFVADTIAKDSLGRDWLHSITAGKVGYVLASLVDYQPITDPDPEPGTHVLEVYLDGVLEYRKEF